MHAKSRIGTRCNQLDKLVMEYDVVAIQEAHGTQAALDNYLNLYPLHLARGSFCENRAAGGIVTIVSPQLARRFTEWHHEIIEAGRCSILSGSSDDGNIQIVNCHVCLLRILD